MRAGVPQDSTQWIALALCLALLLVAAALPRLRLPVKLRPLPLLLLGAALASLLSAVYIVVYLRGAPRIIDATSYFLEARAIASGHLAWPVAEPVSSTLGRFLVQHESSQGIRAAVIFPPGYPSLLALGFLVHAPMIVGPLLAAAIVLATYDLASRVQAICFDLKCTIAPIIPALAAVLSIECAALRYHTADTMSHGFAALCFATSLSFTLRAIHSPTQPRRNVAFAGFAGLAAGALVATRPVSALALLVTLLWLLLPRQPAPRLRMAIAMAIGTIPGLVLLLAHQHAATGTWASSQAMYYAASDGPPSCFRYGFGANIGCLGEHGDFVARYLPHGYGLVAAFGTTARRLLMHLVDPLNAEPLFAVVFAGVVIALRHRALRPIAFAVLCQIAVYAPFYFDGNYPGGGARMFADILPVEHVLASLAVAHLAAKSRDVVRNARIATSITSLRWMLVVMALSLAGFAFRAGFDHAHLREREGGAPMFDPKFVARAGIAQGLVFVDTDHGFNLGYDPDHRSSIQVRRFHGDALDRMAWNALGRPLTYRYRFQLPEGSGVAQATITPLDFESSVEDYVIEGESLWPARLQRAAWALPQHADGTCAQNARWLAIFAAKQGDPMIHLALPTPWLRGTHLAPRIVTNGNVAAEIQLLVDQHIIHRWQIQPGQPSSPRCSWLTPQPIPHHASRIDLVLIRDKSNALFALDALNAFDRKTVDP